MRPQKAQNKITKAIARSLGEESFLPLSKVKFEISVLLKKAIKRESYVGSGYYDDVYSLETLSYISDRFNCAGRLMWLLKMAQNNKPTQED